MSSAFSRADLATDGVRDQGTRSPLPARGVKPKRVLIVEDQFDNREIYREILEHAGYEVLEAVNGRDGVDAARRDKPDLILMDLSMPVMTGWQALEELRKDERLMLIPVLAVSAHVLLDGGYEAATEAGFLAYLTKPVEPNRVLQVVREHLGDE